MSEIKSYLTLEHRLIIYNAYLQPLFNYCNMIWGNSSDYNVSKITKLQRKAVKVILEHEFEELDSARMQLKILSFDQNVFSKQSLNYV